MTGTAGFDSGYYLVQWQGCWEGASMVSIGKTKQQVLEFITNPCNEYMLRGTYSLTQVLAEDVRLDDIVEELEFVE